MSDAKRSDYNRCDTVQTHTHSINVNVDVNTELLSLV